MHEQEIHERKVEDFGAGGGEGESGQVLRAAAARVRAAAEATRRVSMEEAGRTRGEQAAAVRVS